MEENHKKFIIEKDFRTYYINYAMSVIISRAIPDIRDGFKPVQRRILYAMNNLGITKNHPYKKSARTVGDVLGKYHPHGDGSVYDAMVYLTQDFKMRYPLIDGHGNWGTIDGEKAAAMRYTESRLENISSEMLKSLPKDTVDFIPNFDNEEKEPVVLPNIIPNILINGSNGIAVGLATYIPPHNLSNVVDTVIYQIENPNCSIKDLVNVLKAPDFPTGGVIINPKDLVKMYSEGHGKIKIRAKYHIEHYKNNRNKQCSQLVFTEIPYNVNLSDLFSSLKILSFGGIKKTKDAKGKIVIKEIIPKIKGITDIYDDSGIDDIRIVMKLDNNTNINKTLALLFKYSKLENNFCSNFVAVEGNKLYDNDKMNLKFIIDRYLNFQKEVLTRRCKYDLAKAEKRIHILEGLKIAINNIDRVIVLIRSSKSTQEAKTNLTNTFNLSEKQTQAILDLKLQRLTKLEIDDVDKEYNDLSRTTEILKKQLSNEKELLELLKTELIEIKDKYGDERKTEIIYEDTLQEISSDELIEDYNCRLILTSQGYIKKHLKQSDNHKIKDDDFIIQEELSTNKSQILLFSNQGNRYKIPCYDLETKEPKVLPQYMPNLIELQDNEQIIAMASIDKPVGYVICVYEDGKISKIDINSYLSSNKKLANCYSNKSKLTSIKYIKEDVNVLLISSEGKALIVNTDRINPKSSRNSQGNVGMKLDNHAIVGCIIDVNEDINFELETEKGKLKEFMLNDIAPTGRNNEERTIFSYILGRCGNGGSFLINTRSNNDKIINFKQL